MGDSESAEEKKENLPAAAEAQGEDQEAESTESSFSKGLMKAGLIFLGLLLGLEIVVRAGSLAPGGPKLT